MAEGIKISVVINTYNADKHLARVLESLSGFDEVVVCDMESNDRTCEIAAKYGCRIVIFPKNDCRIVEPARQFAIDHTTHPWVLVLDADELITQQMREYLYRRAAEMEKTEVKGLQIPRKNYFMGRFMHASYPDYVLRFFDKRVTVWPAIIHASPQVDGGVERLPSEKQEYAIAHLANDSVEDILRKNNTYSDYELVRRREKKYGVSKLFLRPFFRFFKSYVLKGGCRDGVPGLIYALLQGYYQFEVVAKLIEDRINTLKNK